MTDDLSNYPTDVQKLIKETEFKWEDQSGASRLSCWFSLSYASWLTIPRVLMEDMPDDWQKRMAICLEEFSSTYKNWTDDGQLYVNMKKDGKFAPLPEHLCNYRRPDKQKIEELKNNDRW